MEGLLDASSPSCFEIEFALDGARLFRYLRFRQRAPVWGFGMPTEIRTITFTNAEIREAIARYCLKTGRAINPSAVSELTFSNEGELSASFRQTPGSPALTFKESEIAAAVLLHCKEHGIPIARRAIKSLQVAKDAVLLQLTLPPG